MLRCPAMYFALIYETVENYLERRTPFREQHLGLVREWHGRGKLLYAGAFKPADGALLVFQAESASEVEQFVQADPYVQQGLIAAWKIREWTVVVQPS
jgi:uncharacterized protein YciI